MPNIRPFEAGNLALRPSETGIEAQAATARRIGGFFTQQQQGAQQVAGATEALGRETAGLGEFEGRLLTTTGARLGSAVAAAGYAAVQYMAHREISHGAAAFTNSMLENEQTWNTKINDPNADPNDPTIGRTFMAQLEPQFDEFRNGFMTEAGRQWAEHHIEQFRLHMANKTAGDMSRLAGQAVAANSEATRNNLSNMVYNDPSSLDTAMATWKSSVEAMLGSSPTLSGVDAGMVRTERMQKGYESLVKSAAIGQIYKTGQVPDWLQNPKYSPYVNAVEQQQFAHAARAQQHYDLAMQRSALVSQRQLADMAVHAAANRNFADNVAFDTTTGRTIIKPDFFERALDIARKNPDAPSAASVAKTYLDWGEAQQREHRATTDPAVYANLMTRFADPVKPLTKLDVLRMEADYKLANHHGTLLREMIDQRDQLPKDPIFHAAIDAIKERVGENIMSDGHERFANAMAAFWPQYQAAKRMPGGLPPNALDMQDENSMIRKMIKQFEPDARQRMIGHMEKAKGLAPGFMSSGAAATLPHVTTKAERDALEPGTKYIGPDGMPAVR